LRHTCQVYVGAKQCGKPAVDCVEIDDAGAHLAMFAFDGALRTRIWMCDNWMNEKNDTR
jgi:hypothetical protein